MDEVADLRTAHCDRAEDRAEIVDRRKGSRTFHSWSREACRQWLLERLRDEPRALVAFDFGMGYPWGADRALFGVQGWHALVTSLRARYEDHDTARSVAESINQDVR